jgi:hypothetical protein
MLCSKCGGYDTGCATRALRVRYLPPPAVIAASIVEDLQNALEQFTAIAEDLNRKAKRNK